MSPRRSPQPAPGPLFADLRRLGEPGRLDQVLAAVTRAIELAPARPAGYVLRASVLLAGARWLEAIADLRRALLLAPDDLLARFLYAQALQAAGLPGQGRAEMNEVLDRLASWRPAALLSDGRTTAEELLAAAQDFLEAAA